MEITTQKKQLYNKTPDPMGKMAASNKKQMLQRQTINRIVNKTTTPSPSTKPTKIVQLAKDKEKENVSKPSKWKKIKKNLLHVRHKNATAEKNIFSNKVPGNLVTEQEKFHHELEHTQEKAFPAYRITYQENSHDFAQKLNWGQEFIWTYSVDGALSIGSAQNNQHSVVADGKDVYAAGRGIKPSARLTPEEEFEQTKALFLEKLEQAGDDPDVMQSYQEMIDNLQRQEQEKFKGSQKTVWLDFQSGHYHPDRINATWAMTKQGWKQAGLKAKQWPSSEWTPKYAKKHPQT